MTLKFGFYLGEPDVYIRISSINFNPEYRYPSVETLLRSDYERIEPGCRQYQAFHNKKRISGEGGASAVQAGV